MREIQAHEIPDSKLEKPFRLIVGGGSGSGKTEFVKRLVNENHFSSPFDKLVYCYPDYLGDCPTEFDQIVEYQPGLCDLTYFAGLPKNSLVILDDMMSECGNSDVIMKLFSVIARKKNLSLIFIVQNIYNQSKQFRNIRLNATNFVLFKFFSATDVNKRFLRDISCNELITKRQLDKVYAEKFAYIFIDLHPQRHSEFCTIRSNIFDRNYTLFHKMEFIAIPKADFLKYFKITKAKKGSIRAIKNEITVRKSKPKKQKSSRKRKRESSEDRRQSESSKSDSTGASSESTSGSE